MNRRPVAVGMLLCEQVIVEDKTRNLTPVNCFARRIVDRIPSDPFPFVAFAILTDGAGEMPLEIIIQRLDNLEEVYQHSARIRFDTPQQEVRCRFYIRDCSFPVAGHYQILLLVDDEIVANRRMVILEKENAT